MHKKRILYLGNVTSRHGFTPTTIEALSLRLESDFDIVMVSSQKNKILRLLDMWWAIIRMGKRIDLVLIDTYSSSAFIYAWTSASISRVLGIPYLALLHGGDLPSRFAKSKVISKNFILNARAIIAPSGYLQSAVVKYFKREANIIPNYIDLDKYPFLLRSRINELNILWVRSLHATYQPELAVQIVSKLRENGIEAKLTMVGPNKDGSLEKCEKLAVELGVAGQVEFTGRLSKEEWINKSADFSVFLNTTSIDNTPVSVMEAMALGMPVVTTKVAGIPFLFEDGTEGIMVEEQSASAFSEALMLLMDQPTKTEAISKAARKKAEDWNWLVVRKQWLSLLNSI